MISILCFFGVSYLLIVAYLYFNQEGMIFQPEVLVKDYKFSFSGRFEEVMIQVEDNVSLNGVLFKSERTKGLVFYLHGNGGSLKGWGDIAKTYTDMGYDIFILDYRGYGKSGGKIISESQFFDDVKKAYAFLLKSYSEDTVIITVYSIGTGPATMLASVNHPKALVLQAPYYSLKETVSTIVPFVPGFIKKYKLKLINICAM
ncbi:alpha/beta fold hydrolase [Flavobacterium sp. DG1-102-2]|uniref:alpha/beta hydrolase n=1 Tax=Flavobacterium sp. DG1-102-2 TaxID=3081663 RepID=UPI002949792E|nr:alpha/beta fold hydrolase [Flavobacterium sp. DG1-102-2]MDV6169835.1 alpha/beta fold hydrolase [Flavobacterium sp. DG1-102-2]